VIKTSGIMLADNFEGCLQWRIEENLDGFALITACYGIHFLKPTPIFSSTIENTSLEETKAGVMALWIPLVNRTLEAFMLN
jgi:hypothetical protein